MQRGKCERFHHTLVAIPSGQRKQAVLWVRDDLWKFQHIPGSWPHFQMMELLENLPVLASANS